MDETLSARRERIDALATATGEYYVVCGRTGQRPVPVDGVWFPDKETATEAARIACAYRSLLRKYDPQTPVHDFVVCQRADDRWTQTPEPTATVGQHSEGDV